MSEKPNRLREIKRSIRRHRRQLLSPLSRLLVNSGVERIAERLGIITPMVVKLMDGGLASQMIMFAKGYHYAKERNLPLYLDLEWFNRCGRDVSGNQNRPFHLFEIFPEIKEQYSDKVIKTPGVFQFLFTDVKPNGDTVEELPPRSLFLKAYGGELPCLIEHIDDMKRFFRYGVEMSAEEQQLAHDIDTSHSCALHVRKGDFVGSVHDVCTDKYYLEAISKMRSLVPDCTFYVFTNDETYVRDMLNGEEGHFVYMTNRSEAQPAVDMWLMQRCKHAIISNSGFSLVPAILSYSKDKEVILPSRWSNKERGAENAKANQLPGWTVIDC